MVSKILKFSLLPSLLASSLALTACNNTSTNNNSSDTTVENAAINTDAQSTPTTQKLSAEEKMSAKLARYRWTLNTATNADTQPITSLMNINNQVVLNFNKYQGQNTISYSVGCNTVNAVYQLQDNILMTEDGMGTKMLCNDLNTAENKLNELMQSESQLSLTNEAPPTLTQITSDSTTLVWRGRMTAQAKYNSRGETIFWAVDANTKLCPNDKAQSCLQVKPITYDDQGIKIDEGEWTAFKGNIEGYEHNPGHDEILRLQRYKLAADGDTDTKYAYVLDMVIESSVSS
ncbi:DUF4377 domain-containing protein [Psychrobacter sp. 1U1]|uniref:DUF4377 domain-containing protein n=2 Tax=unclassified Psychrobacter TaxID=196806 RepID=UPI003F46D6B7